MPVRFMPWRLTAIKLIPSTMNWGSLSDLLDESQDLKIVRIANLVARRAKARYHYGHGKSWC